MDTAVSSLLIKGAANDAKEATLAVAAKLVIEERAKAIKYLPRGFMKKIIEDAKGVGVTITKDDINNYIVRKVSLSKDAAPIPKNARNQRNKNDTTTHASRNKGGRPKGTTKAISKEKMKANLDAKNEICKLYQEELERVKAINSPRKYVEHGFLQKTIDSVKKRRNISDVNITTDCIRQRFKRNKITITNPHPGPESAVGDLELIAVEIIIKMSRMRQSLTPSDGLALLNSLANNPTYEKEIREWKKKHNKHGGTKLGRSYWDGFMFRHGDKIKSSKGVKFELNRSRWCTYANFYTMYSEIMEELIDAKLAVKRKEPAWMDGKGNIVDEKDAVGCKVPIDIIHPDWIIFFDEVGCDTSQKGDGNAGGEKRLSPAGWDEVPAVNVNTKGHHFTLLGLTLGTGEPLMCVIIFSGERRNLSVEMGIDYDADAIGSPEDNDYYVKNMGKGKRFPCGPECTYKGKTIPCLCEWSPNGSMTSKILRTILETLDSYKLFDRSTGRKPFLIIDGHGSRLEHPFVEYINTKETEWVVCIGVPYATDLWQVGDSKEQNGSYKIAIYTAKSILMDRKMQLAINPTTIEPIDIIWSVNYAWPRSFARVESNKKAISDRGWLPFNMCLLLHKAVASRMTLKEKKDEARNNFVIRPFHAIDYTAPTNADDSRTSCDNDIHSQITLPASPNFGTGKSGECLRAILREDDLLQAREDNKVLQEKGKDEKKETEVFKKATSGILYTKKKNCGNGPSSIRIGKNNVETLIMEHFDKKQTKEVDAFSKAKLNYREIVLNARAVHKIPQEKWKKLDYKYAIAPLKRKQDGGVSNLSIAQLKTLYASLSAQKRQLLPFEAHIQLNTSVSIPNGADFFVDLSDANPGEDNTLSYQKMDMNDDVQNDKLESKESVEL